MPISRATPASSAGAAAAGADGAQSVDQPGLRANKLDLVERLADDLAHEIKNPLHSMVINLEVLKRRIARSGRNDQSELARYAGVLGAELERVNERIEMLLQLVRTPRGAEPTTLANAVADLAGLVELERERCGVEIDFVPPAFTGHGYLPPAIARQLVLNLLLIALDALRDGGRLEIRTSHDGGWERLVATGELQAGVAAPHVEDRQLDAARQLAETLHGYLEVCALKQTRADDAGREAGFELRLSLPSAG